MQFLFFKKTVYFLTAVDTIAVNGRGILWDMGPMGPM